MLTTQVACPHCQATLKSAKAIPARTEVKCPKCQAKFKTPADAAGGISAASVTANSPVYNSHPLSKIQSGEPAYSPRAIPASAAAPDEWPAKKNTALPWVIGGGAAFTLLGGLLIFFCFFTGNPPADNQDGSKDNSGAQANNDDAPKEIVFKPLPPRPLIPLTKEEQGKVDDMVIKAVDYLKKRQLPDGTWPFQSAHGGPKEMAAFAGMTLLECGVNPADPAIVKAAKVVRDNCPHLVQTYGLSMALLFLDRLGDPADTERIQQLAGRLVAGQTTNGGWGYNCRVLSKVDQDQLLKLLKDMGVQKLSEFRQANPDKKWSPLLTSLPVLQDVDKIPAKNFDGSDNSNTQFAMLALWAARRRDLPLDRPLHHVVQRFRHSQNPIGSWNYHIGNPRDPAQNVPTMTCPGLIALAIGYGLNPPASKGNPLADEAIQKGLNIIAPHIDNKTNPKAQLPMMYFLWSVERVAVLYSLPKIVDKEWYAWGMTMLHSKQRPNGSWQAPMSVGYSSDILDTCFALLFLQRANLAQDLTDKLQTFGGGGNGGSEPAMEGRRE